MPHREFLETHEPPAGMTDEQILYFAELNAATARKAARKVRNQALVGYVIVLIAVIVNFGIQQADNDAAQKAIVQSGQVVAVDGCNRDFNTAGLTRGVLMSAKKSVQRQLKAGVATPDQAKRATDFYNDQLQKYQQPDCRPVANILTSNPDAPVKIPVPLHP